MKKRIKNIVAGTTGMAIISKGTAFTCVEQGDDKFFLMQQPEENIKSEYTRFRLIKNQYFYEREEKGNKIKYYITTVIVYLPILLLYVIFFSNISKWGTLQAGSIFTLCGSYLLASKWFLNRLKIKCYETERVIAQKRAALNKAVNAYCKLGKVPNLEEIRHAGFIKPNASGEIDQMIGIGMILTGIGIVLSLAISNNIIIVGIIAMSAMLIIKFKIYNWMEISRMDKPSNYELNEARILICYYDDEFF